MLHLKKMEKAPILLFVYNRPEHTKRALEALKGNGAEHHILYIFADGPKNGASNSEIQAIDAVHSIISEINWFKTVHIQKSNENRGLAQSVITGVSKVLKKHDRVIVLEDDIVCSPYFLDFMNQGLKLYQENDSVWGISGFTFVNYDSGFPDHFLLNRSSSWGWATWKSTWEKINFDGEELLHAVDKHPDKAQFDFGNEPFYQMLLDQVSGSIDSWAIRFYANLFLHKAYFVFPRKTLVKNIGFDYSGTHTSYRKRFIDDIDHFNPNLSKQHSFDISLQKKVARDLKRINNPGSFINKLKSKLRSFKSL